MPPNSSSVTGVLFEGDTDGVEHTSTKGVADHRVARPRKMQIVWLNVVLFSILHVGALYGAFILLTGAAMWQTYLQTFIFFILSGLGVTAGAHRLWAHKSYKAKTPLKILLTIMNTLAFQDAVIDWARDHRMHHKYSETDADPHNATRGFFFSHMGWLLVRKHPEIKAKAHTIDCSDLLAEPILVFQKKYYSILMPLICFVMPIVVPMIFWGESFINSLCVATMFRYASSLHITWLVNSAAHVYGIKPYDQHISPVQVNRLICVLLGGEGFHNYHHTFPWDYKAAELGGFLNFTKSVIDLCAKIGWAYDLKTAPLDIIEKRAQRTGDGSRSLLRREYED